MLTNTIVATISLYYCNIRLVESIISITEKQIKWFGMKVTPGEKRKIQHLARKQGVSQKEAVMQLVDRALALLETKPKKGSFYEKAHPYIGKGSGSRDLSISPRHLDGFGE